MLRAVLKNPQLKNLTTSSGITATTPAGTATLPTTATATPTPGRFYESEYLASNVNQAFSHNTTNGLEDVGFRGALDEDVDKKLSSDVVAPQRAFLGPNIWDEVLPIDGLDLNLEFMNPEDFLAETGIDLSSSRSESPSSRQLPLDGPPHHHHHRPQLEESQSSSSCSSVSSHALGRDGLLKTSSHVQESISNPATHQHHQQHPSSMAPTRPQILERLLKGETDDEGEYEDEEDEPKSASPTGSSELPIASEDLFLATVPGEAVFNPRKRKFVEDDLKPRPVMRKAKKQYVPEEMKDDKYWERRRKNNVAAKRARDAQRIKMNQIMVRAAFLENQNANLRREIEEVSLQNQELSDRLRRYDGDA